MTEAPLTPKQKLFLMHLIDVIWLSGIPPTRAEIARHFGFTPNAAECHLKALARKGYITLVPNVARGIKLAEIAAQEQGEQMNEMEIQDHKTVYVAWTNTDLTEGRGRQIPLAVAELESTALRMGRKGSVMGCDCHVTSVMAVKIAGHWLAPCVIHGPTPADERAQERTRQRRSAMDRARAAGLSDDDIRAIQGTSS